MAKINWVFQDEQGTNLNRYRATNVETGEEVVFDLLRGGNVSVVGTPLNAEKLNSLISAINDLYDSKLDKTGGTLTGGLTINGATNGYSLNGSGYVKGSWLQSTTKKDLTYNATMFVVYDNEGWLYYRSPSQVKSDIGLGNVDNTSDLNKPISSATQSALDLKATKEELKDYVKSTTLSSYVTTTTLDTRLGSYASISYVTNQLANYVTSSDLTTKLANYVTTQSLEQTLQDYVENTNLVSNYVTYNNLNSTLQNYAQKSSIPTYYEHNITMNISPRSSNGKPTMVYFSIINKSQNKINSTTTLSQYFSTNSLISDTSCKIVNGSLKESTSATTSDFVNALYYSNSTFTVKYGNSKIFAFSSSNYTFTLYDTVVTIN